MTVYATKDFQYAIPATLKAEIQLTIERAVREAVSTAFTKLFDRPVVELLSNPSPKLLIEPQSLPKAAIEPQQQPRRRQRRQRRHRSSRRSAKLLIEPTVESIVPIALEISSGPLLALITDVTACRMQLRPPYHSFCASRHRSPALESLILDVWKHIDGAAGAVLTSGRNECLVLVPFRDTG
ncbi:hypothetical protein BDZ45DRAFT_669335 [Acephala macrosclerotiorum]|nr:hypothetical protein BDZ45DRAFT_669335 [Acephala macrosclerotiorum]